MGPTLAMSRMSTISVVYFFHFRNVSNAISKYNFTLILNDYMLNIQS